MYNDWLKLYCGLGAFRGLELHPTENILIIINKNAPMKAFSLKAEGPNERKFQKRAFSKTEIKYDFDNRACIQSYGISLINSNFR